MTVQQEKTTSKVAEIEWSPTTEQIKHANMTKFMEKHGLFTYQELHARSLANPDWFYPAVWEELGIRWYKPFEQVLDVGEGPQWANWFTGGRTNVVYYSIEKQLDNYRGQATAVIAEKEDGSYDQLSYHQLNEEVNRFAAGLKDLGIQKGDRVAFYLPQIKELPISFFACCKIGAVAVPIFSGYATDAVVTRLTESNAKLVITADGTTRRGKKINLKKTIDQAVVQASSVEHVIVAENTGELVDWTDGRDRKFHSLTTSSSQVETEVMEADDPLMIIYTSGTTGKPKGTVHSHASFPLKCSLDMFFCFDLKEEDRIFWLTDFGWMMGPWVILGTAVHGAALVMYEGSHDFPAGDRLWNLVEKHKVTILGMAPTVIRSLIPKGTGNVESKEMTSLRILGSTGEAWSLEAWRWFSQNVGKGRLPIINYSGGTEVSGGILGCYPTMPQKPGGFNGPIPGMEAIVIGTDGTRRKKEQIGELALANPFLGRTQSFWNDDQRYLNTYWSSVNGIWSHGDLAKQDKDGFWFLLGRSDDTLKIAGKRIGPSEIEEALLHHPSVTEAAAIGVPHDIKGETAIVFVVAEGNVSSADLQDTAVERLGKALKPEKIIPLPQLPKTQSNKVARRLLKASYLGKPLGDISTLQNPEVLKEVRAVNPSK